MQPRDAQRLEHILDYCSRIETTVARLNCSYEAFFNDADLQQSISFSILQIGELAGTLSDELRQTTASEISWQQVKGMRNIIAHQYGSIRLDVIWNTVTNDIPILKAFCEKQLSEI